MKVIDPGHVYRLRLLDGEDRPWMPEQKLEFVKREGEGYPGNVGHHPGTTTQEVLRALIDRTIYVNKQIPCIENTRLLMLLRKAIYQLELRAATRHGRDLHWRVAGYVHGAMSEGIETLPTCSKCNHIGCEGECHE